MLRAFAAVLCAAFVLAVRAPRAGAVTHIASADGQFWDIQDTSAWSQDSGGIATGGHALPFNGFGYLKLQVRRRDATFAGVLPCGRSGTTPSRIRTAPCARAS